MRGFVSAILMGLIVLGATLLSDNQQEAIEKYADSKSVSTSGFVVNTFDLSQILNLALNKESNPNFVPYELPSFIYSNRNFYLGKKLEQLKNNRISDYLYFSECTIARFEGPNIIHPFFYFT